MGRYEAVQGSYTLGQQGVCGGVTGLLSRNHIERRLSSAILVDAEPNEQYNADSETRRRQTMVRSTSSNFADFAFVRRTRTQEG
jgi:hypothetical protein